MFQVTKDLANELYLSASPWIFTQTQVLLCK